MFAGGWIEELFYGLTAAIKNSYRGVTWLFLQYFCRIKFKLWTKKLSNSIFVTKFCKESKSTALFATSARKVSNVFKMDWKSESDRDYLSSSRSIFQAREWIDRETFNLRQTYDKKDTAK